MDAKLGSFRYSFAEKRERLQSTGRGFSGLGPAPEFDEESQQQSVPLLSFLSSSAAPPRRSAFLRRWAEKAESVARVAWQMGKSDPRKIVFSAKMGLALTLISLLIYFREPFTDLSRYSVWAILTVVVVFEFSIGATLSKGLNRGLGTLSAGGLALGMAELSNMAGKWDETFIIGSIFLVGFCATYAKLYPTMKPYEYGFRVFLLTYCFIMVSGHNTGEFIHTAVTRFVLIALGAAVGLGVNIGIYPIWAGEDLHNLVANNFTSVAASLEGCVNSFLNCVEYERVPSKILTYQVWDDPVYKGYRSAVESTSQEETLLGFAIWEPPHGRYRMFKYPWRNYVKVSGALRHCSFMVMALHGCILAEIQAPPERRQVFRDEIRRVGAAGSKVLTELGSKVKKMEKLGHVDVLYEVHEAAEELQQKIDRKSYLFVNSESWEIGSRPDGAPPQESFKSEEEEYLEYKSLSDASLNLSSSLPTNTNTNADTKQTNPLENSHKKNVSWHAGSGVASNAETEQSKTYENATALSLATFTSLLIEFVARLQNIVDSFQELSEKARFKDPELDSAAQTPLSTGFHNWLKS